MESIDRILNFINNTEATEAIPSEIETEEATPLKESMPDAMPSDVKQIEATPLIDATPAITEAIPALTDKEYKTVLRKLNQNIKKNNFPCIVSINGINKVYNNIDELNNELTTLKSNKQKQLKEIRKKNIDNYKHYNKIYNKDIDDIEEDGIIYAKGPIKAIRKDEKIYSVPKTNTRDRKRIYNSIKDNKKVLTELVKAKDENEFKEINNNNLTDEALTIYKRHSENTINTDKTWTKDAFISMMDKMISNNANTVNKRTIIRMPINGFNPLLFKSRN